MLFTYESVKAEMDYRRERVERQQNLVRALAAARSRRRRHRRERRPGDASRPVA